MKTDISKLQFDILDEPRQRLLKKVIPQVKGFVLGGGTALALQIAHRQSFDFDFFSEKEIPKDLLENLSQVIEIKEVAVDSGDELTFFDSHNVKFTFLFYHFKPCFDILEFTNGLRIFSVKEIAVKKAYTIGRRGVYRDYFDLYVLLRDRHTSLEEIITGAENEHKGLFNGKLFLEQLVYFEDLPDFDITPIKNESLRSVSEVKQFLEQEVKTYLNAKEKA